jgi:HD-GYP domain-containing protein (c-di-GMP phosphodiesterase class II)
MGDTDGLSLEEIPISSRIIAVVDAFDAMISDRPYQRAMASADALAELRRYAGTQFDPTVVEAFATTISSCSSEQVAARDAAPVAPRAREPDGRAGLQRRRDRPRNSGTLTAG